MPRLAPALALSFLALPLFADVQSVGDVSFAVPDGWKYQQGSGFGSMVLTEGQNFWLMAVYAPLASSGDAAADLKAGWARIMAAGLGYQGPPLSNYRITHSLGYGGQYGDGSSVNRTTYARMYVLETPKGFIPVVTMSRDGITLNATQHVALDLVGSVRLAPLRAQAFKTTISVADLVGHWTYGVATSQDFYNQQTGQYEGNASAFASASYVIAADGSFVYKSSGLINGRTMTDADTGVVQLGQDLVIFSGKNHVVRYRFMNITYALDGSTVLTFLPAGIDVARLNILRDREQWSRAPTK